LRRRQCRRRPDDLSRAVLARRLWMADGGARVGAGARDRRSRLLVLHGRRPGDARADRGPGASEEPAPATRAAALSPSLALLALLLLHLRGFGRALPVAPALPDRRLPTEYRDGRNGRRPVLLAGRGISRLWRPSGRQVRRPPGDVLD